MGKKTKPQAYVVFKGRTPGVYFTWDECKAQVEGFTGNAHRSFATLAEAEQKWQEHLDCQLPVNMAQSSDHRSSLGHEQQSKVSHKRPTLLIDLTGSDDENPPLAKRVQHKALGSSSGDYLPLGVSAWNSSNEDTAGIVRNYTPYVSKLPPAYIPQVQCRPPPLSKTGYFSPYFTSSISGPSSYSTPRPMMIQSREQIEIEEGPNIVLTTEQEAVVRLALSGENLFLTGAGGSGKTITLRSILAHLQRQTRKYQVIAPTAIAALPLNGKTTYSFFGWNPDTLHEPIQDIIKTRKSWVEITAQSVEVLIIEEISMVENQFLERMNLKMQAIFNNSQPFGGTQVIFLGDFHQLPPVKPFQNCLQCGSVMTRLKTGESDVACMKCNMAFENGEKWAFKSPVWQQLNMRHVQLQQVHRQKDKKFQDILFKIRHGIMLSVEEWRGLEAKKQLPPGICAVRLMAQRKDVHALNMRELSKIINPPRSWAALDTYSPRFKDPETHRTPWVEENPLENHRFPKLLTLKVGAKVILLTNLDPKNGLINGSQGEVVGFEPDAGDADDPPISYLETGNDDRSGFGKKRLRWEVKTRGAPIVRFANGSKKTIFGTSMTSRFGKNISYQYLATRAQIPLTLAWALTIHKSQGMTLQYIEVLSRDIFEKGQFYVALSRGTTLAGLTVTGYTREQLPVDSDVVEFYENTEWECLTPGFQASKEEAIAKIQLPDIIGISDDDDKDDKDDEE